MINKIDEYYLNMPVQETLNLKEFSTEEYTMFKSMGIKRIFKDEKIYHGKDIKYFGVNWNTIIGATAGKVYKIVLQNLNERGNESDSTFASVEYYLSKEMGKESQYEPSSNRYSWHTADMTALVSQRRSMGIYGIQFIITANIVKKSVWDSFWIIACLIVAVSITTDGLLRILFPRLFMHHGDGSRISVGEYQMLPIKAKIVAMGIGMVWVIIGAWMIYKQPRKKDKIIAVTCIAIFVALYCFLVASSIK